MSGDALSNVPPVGSGSDDEIAAGFIRKIIEKELHLDADGFRYMQHCRPTISVPDLGGRAARPDPQFGRDEMHEWAKQTHNDPQYFRRLDQLSDGRKLLNGVPA